MQLIIGLGNPGEKYKNTRHNVGFMILDKLQKSTDSFNFSNWQHNTKFKAELSEYSSDSIKIILAKPTTFMNESGVSVKAIADYYRIPKNKIVIVHDDKDINLGEIKIQSGRGHAGHNGVKSIFSHLGEEDIVRVRIGIKSANENKMSDISNFVLGRFGIFEKFTLGKVINEAVTAITKLIK